MRTRVGYAGGTTIAPTYRQIGDHSETLQIDFDPNLITYDEILRQFWENHNAVKERNYKGRQYISILLYHDESQRETAKRLKAEWERLQNGEIQTEFQAYANFYVAEDYHQKYYLKRYVKATSEIQHLFYDHDAFINSTISARLNGFVKGFGTMNTIKEEIENWGLNAEEKTDLLHHLGNIKW